MTIKNKYKIVSFIIISLCSIFVIFFHFQNYFNNKNCIQNKYEYSYPLVSNSLPYEINEIIPNYWKEFYDFNNSDFSFQHVKNIFDISDDEIWLYDSTRGVIKITFYKNEIKVYKIKNFAKLNGIIANEDFYILGYYYEDSITYKEIPYFAVYNKQTDKFEEIVLPIDIVVENYDKNVVTNIVKDNSDEVWFFLGNQLLNYSPLNEKFNIIDLKLYDKSIVMGLSSIAIKKDIIWFVDFNGVLNSYNIASKENKIYFNESLLNDENVIKKAEKISVFIDEESNIWLNNFSYYSIKEDKWYMINIPSLFLDQFVSVENIINYISYDGYPKLSFKNEIWFQTDSSIIILNKDEKAWCHIASASDISIFSKDKKILFLADNKLYTIQK